MIPTQWDISEHAYELAVMDEFGDREYGEYQNYDIHIMVARFIKTFVPEGVTPELGEPHEHPNALEEDGFDGKLRRGGN